MRHDDNDEFADATTYRLAAAYQIGSGFAVRASAAEGFAAPTFTEQFGFFPGSFAGDPDLEPESSFGWDAGLDWTRGPARLSVTYFRADLEDEIVSTFDPATFLSGVANADDESRREGVEIEGGSRFGPLLLRGSYTWLDADELGEAGGLPVREIRRAEHSASLAAAVQLPAAELALTANYVGERRDIDFGSFPQRDVTLDDYVLATLSAEVPLTDRIGLTGRVENLLDEDYQDVFGFETQGIGAHAGVRLQWGG